MILENLYHKTYCSCRNQSKPNFTENVAKMVTLNLPKVQEYSTNGAKIWCSYKYSEFDKIWRDHVLSYVDLIWNDPIVFAVCNLCHYLDQNSHLSSLEHKDEIMVHFPGLAEDSILRR